MSRRLQEKCRQVNEIIQRCVIENPDYDIRADGTVWTRISKNGLGLMPDGQWRRADTKVDRDGYRIVSVRLRDATREHTRKYRRREVKAHRIVYAKFKGELDCERVVNHIDRDRQNNKPGNLEQITQLQNYWHGIRERKRARGEEQLAEIAVGL